MPLTKRQAARKGKQIEFRLMEHLEAQGWECSRSDLSRFPDVLAWDSVAVMFCECKYASTKRGVAQAKYMFKQSAQERKFFPEGCPVRLYVWYEERMSAGYDDGWLVWDYVDSELIAKEA